MKRQSLMIVLPMVSLDSLSSLLMWDRLFGVHTTNKLTIK